MYNLTDDFFVDFSVYDRDVVTEGLDRMLGQHYDKCVLRQFVAVFLNQVQELYDACIEMQKARSVYFAEGENLNALGRIVGADRTPWVLDESYTWFKFTGWSTESTKKITEDVEKYEYYPWPVFKFDSLATVPDESRIGRYKKIGFDSCYFSLHSAPEKFGKQTWTVKETRTEYTYTPHEPTTDPIQGFDKAPFWVEKALKGKFLTVDDSQYRADIVTKAIKNHTLVGSLQEVQQYIKRALGYDVSFEKVGPNSVRVYVPLNISQTALMRITQSYTDDRVDGAWHVPYPVTLDIAEVAFVPSNGWMIFDRKDHGFDQKPIGVLSETAYRRPVVFMFDRENYGFDIGKMITLQKAEEEID